MKATAVLEALDGALPSHSEPHQPHPPHMPNAQKEPTAVERLPFRIRVVQGDEALRKAVQIRHLAYARHVPELAETLREPEEHDYERDCMILLAESKLDGSPIGTIRVQSNRYRPLGVEHSVELPEHLRDACMVEATRLAVAEGRAGRVVKAALIKALYLYCLKANIAWVIAGARPGLDRQYEALLMDDLFPGRTVALQHSGGIAHRIMALDVHGARARWQAARHSLVHFMCGVSHPDIDLSGADTSPWRAFRAEDAVHAAPVPSPAAPSERKPAQPPAMLYPELFRSFEEVRWSMETDIPWDQFDPLKLTDEQALTIKMNAITEWAALPATEMFLRDNRHDSDISAFMSVWFFEEQKHALVLMEYLRRFRPDLAPTEEELHAVRFQFDPAPALETLMMHFCGEIRLNHWYRRAAEWHTEPVIRRIYDLISRDEARHAGAYLRYMKKAMQSVGTEATLAFAKMGFLMASSRRSGKPLHPTNLHVNKEMYPQDTVQSKLPDPGWLERWLDTQIRFDDEREKKVIDMILINLSKLFDTPISSLHELNRLRRTLKSGARAPVDSRTWSEARMALH